MSAAAFHARCCLDYAGRQRHALDAVAPDERERADHWQPYTAKAPDIAHASRTERTDFLDMCAAEARMGGWFAEHEQSGGHYGVGDWLATYIKYTPGATTARQLAALFGAPETAVKAALWRLVHLGRIAKTEVPSARNCRIYLYHVHGYTPTPDEIEAARLQPARKVERR